MDTTISVIIPTLNAERELPALLQKLAAQDHPIEEVLVVDSSSDDRTQELCQQEISQPQHSRGFALKLLTVQRKDFDHGATRDWALRQSVGSVVVFMTQDAVPANNDFLGNLVAPLQDGSVAVSTGRQLPKADATAMEQLVRQYNYPADSSVRTRESIQSMGIKAFFCSDVCAAYNRTIYLALGGFDHPLKTNEDMFFAAKALNSGYKVAYAADAAVYHSHNFTLKEQYKRNYIQGYEIERHKQVLGDASEMSEGTKLVKYVSANLLKRGRVVSWVRFGFDCVARLAGNRAGARDYRKSQSR